MKKYFLLIVCALLGITAFAQQEPNRLLVRDKMGQLTPFHIDRIDSISFTTVEGRVAADVTVKDVTIKNAVENTEDMITLSIQRTQPCVAFKVACLKKSMADKITDDSWAAYYFAQSDHSMYFQDFTEAQMTNFDFEFVPNTEYYILSLGYDQYGTPCEMQKTAFTTPAVPLVGEPSVAYEIAEVTSDSISISFKPNADVAGFASCIFPKGQAEAQFNMFAALMGLTCMGDMIKMWGLQGNANDTTFIWTSMAPDTEYEVYVQCWDVNGTYADMIIIPIVTKKLGGEGKAEVSIEIKETKYYEEYNKFTQRVVFTPNENVSLYRVSLFDYSFYEEQGEDAILEYLLTEQEGNPYWNLYKTDDGLWTLQPNSKYVATAIGQNVNGEWGELNVVEFTTPATADVVVPPTPASAPAVSKVAPFKGGNPARIAKPAKEVKGQAPCMSTKFLKKGLQLTGK